MKLKKSYLMTLIFLGFFFVLTNAIVAQDIFVITDIVLEGNKYINDEEIMEEIRIEVGELLDEEKIKADLENLFALGYFMDLGPYFQPYQGGVKVIYEFLEYL